ncbi:MULTISPECIES: sirohydrochlorin chelatase [Bacillaceae]|uniref:Cobalamin biosynthesis protein CbiX n=1 Tax=Evansella alkalicola TaxID=745819 RepID=A0ABS6JY83_9BACI|nr:MULTISPECIES: CbiX/SirB N-terminal domain-containing protein [Bacillaceae]MBU9723564.1 cobalamin biosynthesis protein CbiX [Bacillus alkalicola]
MSTMKTGVLVIAHGSRDITWVNLIEDTIEKVNISYPITIGYLELVEGKSIPEAVDHLVSQGIKRIIAVPLFISSGSTHLEEIQYSLGIIPTSRIQTELPRMKHNVDIIWCDPMNHHPLILDILSERVNHLSENPANEVVMLVAHGSAHEGFQEKWEDMLREMTSVLKKTFEFSNVIYGTLRPDTVREKAKTVPNNRSLLVIPVFLSEGYFTRNVIPKKLVGIDYRWSGKTYLPHPSITKWIEETVMGVEARNQTIGGEEVLLRYWG